jgi:hypothetical protein
MINIQTQISQKDIQEANELLEELWARKKTITFRSLKLREKSKNHEAEEAIKSYQNTLNEASSVYNKLQYSENKILFNKIFNTIVHEKERDEEILNFFCLMKLTFKLETEKKNHEKFLRDSQIAIVARELVEQNQNNTKRRLQENKMKLPSNKKFLCEEEEELSKKSESSTICTKRRRMIE